MNKNQLLFSLIIIIGFLTLFQMHEQVHVSIYEDYDIESKIEYNHFPFYLVTVTEPIVEGKCNEVCKLANEINDVVGYNLMGLYFIISLGFLLLLKKTNKKGNV